MRSTGEVMGIDTSFGRAFAKSQIAGGVDLPMEGKVFLSVKDQDKPLIVDLARQMKELGFEILSTRGTARFLKEQGIEVTQVNKVLEGRPHIVDLMKNGDVDLLFNTTEGGQAIADSVALRRTALLNKIPYYTTISGARAACLAIASMKTDSLDVATLQSYSMAS
jgi:carbamoyl-phosphate synthase large subunit